VRVSGPLGISAAAGPVRRIVESPHYKWWVYFAIAIGMAGTVMDQSGVNIAIPKIADHFVTDIPTVQWVALGYVLSTSAMLLPAGRLSDMMGRKRVYIGGFMIFMAAAALGGSSQNFSVLILAKVVQGIGAAGIQSNGMAIIADVFPDRERGKALGLYMAIIGTGSISGPIVGGLLVSGLGWRSVFFAGVPVGIVAMLAAWAVLKGGRPEGRAGSGPRRFDWAGASLSSAALISFLLGMTNAYRLGWTSPPILASFVIAFALLAGFLWWENRTADPMLDLTFFRSKVFSVGVAARSLSFLGSSAVFFLMPFYLIEGLGYQASRAGLILVPGALGMAITGPISGRLSDKVGTRWPAVLGMAMSAAGMVIFSRLTIDSPAYHVIVGTILTGSGMGTFSSANTSAVLSSMAKERYGIVSAFVNVVRTSSNVTGVALATTIVTFTMGSLGFEPSLAALADDGHEGVRGAFISGMNRAFLVGAGFAVAALVLSVLRGESQGGRLSG
jgi:EmrB/QacA subfamily drug resistance transporter